MQVVSALGVVRTTRRCKIQWVCLDGFSLKWCGLLNGHKIRGYVEFQVFWAPKAVRTAGKWS